MFVVVQKSLQSEPIAVTVNTCQYWISFNPKKWSEANQSCQKLDATLVVLDSITTLNHISNIMIDNRGSTYTYFFQFSLQYCMLHFAKSSN